MAERAQRGRDMKACSCGPSSGVSPGKGFGKPGGREMWAPEVDVFSSRFRAAPFRFMASNRCEQARCALTLEMLFRRGLGTVMDLQLRNGPR